MALRSYTIAAPGFAHLRYVRPLTRKVAIKALHAFAALGTQRCERAGYPRVLEFVREVGEDGFQVICTFCFVSAAVSSFQSSASTPNSLRRARLLAHADACTHALYGAEEEGSGCVHLDVGDGGSAEGRGRGKGVD